jgi:2-polyprenyl-3-methyl-5-hydroxy-6-metoxy-1,4-benzoquinol methylase
MIETSKEENRRSLNLEYDTEPSDFHKLNLRISLPYIRNKRVLDVGCWSGQFERLAVKHVKKLYAIDPGVEAIKYASSNILGVEFSTGSVFDMPYSDSFFDAVTFLDVIEHLPKNKEGKALWEIRRVLKNGGYLIVSTPNKQLISVLLDPAYFLTGHRHYSKEHLINMLEGSGFKVVKVKQTAGIVRLLTTNVDYLFKHVFKTKINYPPLVKKRLKKEMRKGFVSNYVVARKIK